MEVLYWQRLGSGKRKFRSRPLHLRNFGFVASSINDRGSIEPGRRDLHHGDVPALAAGNPFIPDGAPRGHTFGDLWNVGHLCADPPA